MKVANSKLVQKLIAAGVPKSRAHYAVNEHERGRLRSLMLTLFARALWTEVIDEDVDRAGLPRWVERWRALGDGFPFINVAALERLSAAQVNLNDLTDVVRSAQVRLIYNIACMLDGGRDAMGDLVGAKVAAELEWYLNGGREEGAHEPLLGPHELVEEMDPSGRAGAPRSLKEHPRTRAKRKTARKPLSRRQR